LKSNHQGKKHV